MHMWFYVNQEMYVLLYDFAQLKVLTKYEKIVVGGILNLDTWEDLLLSLEIMLTGGPFDPVVGFLTWDIFERP